MKALKEYEKYSLVTDGKTGIVGTWQLEPNEYNELALTKGLGNS